MSRTIPLNYDWHFRPDFRIDYLETENLAKDFTPCMLPHTMKLLPFNNFSETEFQFVGSYYLDFALEPLKDTEIAILRFHGVMVTAEVWLNGTEIIAHEGGYTPFEVDITDKLAVTGPNRLFVKVDGREQKDIPPFGNVVDYLAYSGIYREVELEIMPRRHIENLVVKTDEAPAIVDTEMDLIVKMTMSVAFDTEAAITFTVKDTDILVHEEVFHSTLAEPFKAEMLMSDIVRWDLDNPKLYHLTVIVSLNGETIDSKTVRFGFRTAKFLADGFVINNQKVKLIGLNRHQSYPYVGYAMPKRQQARDAEILKKELGCNIVRTSHYMQSDHFLDRCDEVGLLVFEEIPGWQYIGNEHFQELTYENLRSMIRRHINHPAIVLWGVRINESADSHDFYTMTNMIAHELDDSRQTGGVRNFAKSEFLEDVYTYNDFLHQGDNEGLAGPNRIAGLLTPYLVTEHNGHMFPTRKNDDEEKRLAQALRHLRVIDDAYGSERYSGAIGWCFADYNTHKEFGSQDRICYHGVSDMFRIPKYASYPYVALKTGEPVLQVASSLTPGEVEKSMLKPTFVFTNCDYVKVYVNDDLLDRFYSDWHNYPNVPKAPIVIEDYIGNRIENDGLYPKRIARRIKHLLQSFTKYGFKLPLSDKLMLLGLMLFHKFTIRKAEEIYGRYVGNWGASAPIYRFEGYIDDVMVKSVVVSQPQQALFRVYPDDTELIHGDTYDVTRVVVKMEDENGNLLVNAHDAFRVETDGLLEVIGPDLVPLVGGSTGVYLRTTGKKGKAKVHFSCPGKATQIIHIDVK